jgi:hypothetical protein
VRASVLLAVLALSTAVSAEELGTLFFTPKEREAMDRMRRGEPTVPGTAVRPPDPVVTGFVKRSDGKSTVFLDKRPYYVTDPKVQPMLEPRIIQRFEPVQVPAPSFPPEAPSERPVDGERNGVAKAPEPPKAAAAPTKPRTAEE